MQKLNWRLSPEEFIERLAVWRSIWRKRTGANRPASKRQIFALTKAKTRWYKSLTGLEVLPVLIRTAGHDGDLWREPDPEDVKIVLLPGSASGTETRKRRSLRRQMKRQLSEAYEAGSESTFELLASRRRRRRGIPSVGEGNLYGQALTRGIYLEAVGAAIVPSLTKAQVDVLEASGATVVENTMVQLEPSSSAPLATGIALDWHLETIGIQHARAANLTGKGVLIGILDSGIDPTHPEFKGKNIYYQKFSSLGEVVAFRKAKDFGDHGTHVSALCSGATVGVAPNADLAVAAVLTKRLPNGKLVGWTAQMLAGMNWLATGGGLLPRPVDVLNASIGGGAAESGYYQTVATNRLKGVPLIAAIGNDGGKGFGKHEAPGMFDCATAVGAIDHLDAVADFSAWGPAWAHPAHPGTHKPDLVAPGVGVRSAVPGGKFATKDGTSMATPIVSGVAALLIERDINLRGAPDALCAQLYALTRPLPNPPIGNVAQRIGRGCVDLKAL